jgi:penicillin-binding protein 1B
MDRQVIAARSRELLSRIRSRLPARRVVFRGALISIAVGFCAITADALVRARLDGPSSRVPTTLYTRAIPWRDGGRRAAPIPVGTLDGAPLDERVPLALAQMPDQLIQAVLAVEDQRFFQHHGLDLRRIGGALVADIRARGITQGGSTITQQLAKNLFLSAGRTPLRKLREAAMAVVLEMRYSKRQILEAYLNEIYLGQDAFRPIHGVGAASLYYFGKDVRRVSLAEAAQLAAMISAPNRTSATRHVDAAQQRRDMVLQLMVQQQRITSARADRATQAELTVGEHSSPALDGRYFRDFAVATFGGRAPARGTTIYTTLDAMLQRAAERAVDKGVDRSSLRGAEAALIAIDPRNGDVLAMVGGRDYATSQFNRAVTAHRQPGSAFKPVVALAALERHDGKPPAFTLASVVEDEPLQVTTGKSTWEPVNYDQHFRGPVTVREAMEQSLNVPFARIGLAVGTDRIVATARRLGITSPMRAVPSLALGSSELSLLELTRAYGVLADAGKLASTRTVLAEERNHGDVSVDSATRATQVVDPAVAYLVTSALEGVVTRGTGRALNEDGHLGGVAGKTGTTSDWRDAWFVAYTSSLVVGVWVGYDDGRSLQMTGASAALPIAQGFLNQVTPDGGWPSFEVPDGIAQGTAGGDDGMSPSNCGSHEVFLAGTEPPESTCSPFEMPSWQGAHDWGEQLARRARQLIEGLIARRREWEQSRGNR